MLCLEKNIHIIAQHLPGVLNCRLRIQNDDRPDRLGVESSHIQTNQLTLQSIGSGPFCHQTHYTAPSLFQLAARSPYASAKDAFLQDWSLGKGYANSSWCLIDEVLSQVQIQRVQLVLIAPVWKSQPWYTVVLKMLISHPWLILEDYHRSIYHEEEMLIPQLAAWHISGIDTQVRTFRMRLLPSCSSHGGQKPTGLTTHSLGDGLAGVIEGVQIPFRVL